jgi:hypothetical protein
VEAAGKDDKKMAVQGWKLSGECMESCNCDYLCPCIFTNSKGAVTHDHCTALQVYRIDRGNAGNVILDGLRFALIIRSGKVMADGDWIFAGIVDARADDAQRKVLAAIVSGEAGGPPATIRDTLVSDFRGVEFHPIEFNMDGLSRSTNIPGVLSYAIDGVPSKVAADSPLYMDNTEFPGNRRVALAQARETHFHAFGLDLDLVGKGNNGHFAPFNWSV